MLLSILITCALADDLTLADDRTIALSVLTLARAGDMTLADDIALFVNLADDGYDRTLLVNAADDHPQSKDEE